MSSYVGRVCGLAVTVSLGAGILGAPAANAEPAGVGRILFVIPNDGATGADGAP